MRPGRHLAVGGFVDQAAEGVVGAEVVYCDVGGDVRSVVASRWGKIIPIQLLFISAPYHSKCYSKHR